MLQNNGRNTFGNPVTLHHRGPTTDSNYFTCVYRCSYSYVAIYASTLLYMLCVFCSYYFEPGIYT